MKKEHKNTNEVQRYTGDLLLQCWAVSMEITDRAEMEGRLVVEYEKRQLALLLKISLLLCAFIDFEANKYLN
jgi:hypothetical protein